MNLLCSERGIFLDRYENYDEDYQKNNNDNIQKPKKNFSAASQLLIIIQLVLCGIILIGALIIKTTGGSLYAAVGTWFYDNYNNSIFTDTKENVFSFVDKTKTTENNNLMPQSESSTDKSDIISEIKSSIHKPLKSGTVTSGYGNRNDEFHKGTDISADKGDEIYSMLDGTVTIAEKDDSYGNYVVVTHQDNIKTLYAHCSELCVKQGETVTAGQKIALVGSTGDADGNHLHLEIIIDGQNINPQDILGKEYT